MNYIYRSIIFFILSSIIWGLIVGIALWVHTERSESVIDGLLGGILVGFVITIVGCAWDLFFRRRVFNKYGKKSYSIIQSKELLVNGEIKCIIKKCINVIESMPCTKEVIIDEDNTKIIGITRKSWNTFGERIELNLSKCSNGIKLQIYSRPRLRTSIFDCGKNIEHVEALYSTLRKKIVDGHSCIT